MKKPLIGLLALAIVVLVAGGIWIYLSLDFIVKRAIEAYAPDIVGAKVAVESVKLTPTSGVGAIHGLAIGNPPGFHSEHSLSVATVDVAIDPGSIAKDVVHVRRIAVIGPVITYESSRNGSNFDAIQRNVARRTAGDKSAASRKETRLVVDQIVIRDARVIYAPEIATRGATISFDLPGIQLTDVGKRQGGVTPAELTNVIVQALVARMATAMGRSAARRGAEILRGR
jgi:uncharacterized protein involved in outer membrane biogenesis